MKCGFSNILFFIFILCWTGLLWTLLIGIIIQDGILEPFKHLTDWNIALQSIYFLIDLLSYFDYQSGEVRKFNIKFLFWAANGSTFLVFGLVPLMFAVNSSIFSSLEKINGGPHNLGFLLNMNFVVHYLPTMIMIIYIVGRRKNFRNLFIEIDNEGKEGLYYFYSAMAIASPLAYVGLYAVINSTRVVYGITTNIWILIAIAFSIVVVVNSTIILLFHDKALVQIKRNKKKQNKLKLNEIESIYHNDDNDNELQSKSRMQTTREILFDIINNTNINLEKKK